MKTKHIYTHRAYIIFNWSIPN